MVKPRKVKVKTGVRWEVVVYENGRGSKRIKKRFVTKADADNFLHDLASGKEYLPEAAREVANIKASQKTFESESAYWLNTKKGSISEAYYLRSSRILRDLGEKYNKLPIHSFNNDLLVKMRNELLTDSRSKATVNRWLGVVTSMIKLSFDQGRIDIMPYKGFKFFDECHDEIDFWELDEIKSFLLFAKNKYPLGTKKRWIYILYLLALNCGPRAGELYGLKVKDFRFERKNILIERQINSISLKEGPTKGKKNRLIPFNSELQSEMKNWIEFNGFKRDDLVFTDSVGKPIRHRNFRKRHFLLDLDESNSRRIRFHDMRHTAITHMVDANFNLKLVQTIAGHADITTTMKYVHLLGNSIENVSDSFCISG